MESVQPAVAVPVAVVQDRATQVLLDAEYLFSTLQLLDGLQHNGSHANGEWDSHLLHSGSPLSLYGLGLMQ